MAESLQNGTLSFRLLRRLYESRRRTLSAMGYRSRSALLISCVLGIAMMTTLMSLSWVQKSDLGYLRGSSGARILDEQTWDLATQSRSVPNIKFLDLASFKYAELIETNAASSAEVTLTTHVPRSVVVSMEQSIAHEPIIVALPDFGFARARVESTWTDPRHFLEGEPLTLSYDPSGMSPGNANTMETITVHFTPSVIQKSILKSAVNQIPLFLAGQIRYKKFQDFLASRRVGSGKQLADIGRVVLAFFTLMLFVFIDSSAECLALGLFMALKALAVVANQRWYPDSIFPPEFVGLLPHILFGFADVMQLYFFTQLARLFAPKPMSWLFGGAFFGIIYGLGANLTPVTGHIDWGHEIWRIRNLTIGVGCLACALPVAVVCFRDKNYHRAAALLLASSGVISQIVTPSIIDIQGITETLWFTTWYNLIETHTPYVFAISTFINVSTLEKRVQALTDSAIQAKLLEQELALGKTVQEAFFRTPPMPEGISLAMSHRAEMFVSGDMIFSHYDDTNKTATALLCDVVGHGVQAALKASICSVICDSIWDVSRVRPDDQAYQRLEIMHRRATGFFAKTSQRPELLAMVGCEVSLVDKIAYFYRANSVLPMIVTRGADGVLRPSVVTVPHDGVLPLPLYDTSFIILFSDGLIDSSRTYKHLVDWLAIHVKAVDHPSAQSIKDVILAFDGWNVTHDDKTMCVLEVA